MEKNNLSESIGLSFKSNNQKYTKKQTFVFKPVRYLKFNDLVQYIKTIQLQQLNESMFPNNFLQLHQKQLNIFLFQIQVQDIYKKWKIIKRLPELFQFKQNLKQKFPDSPLIFSFPEPQQSDIDNLYATSILQLFCTFLTSISKSQEIIKEKRFLLFIENFVSPDKKKIVTYFQRNLLKKAGGRHTQSSFNRIMNNFISWRSKFFTITSEGIFYTDQENLFNIKQMLPFNQSFSILHGQIKTGYTYGLIINSSHRILQIDAQNIFNFLLFIYFIRKIISSLEGSKINRFNSFAKIRQECCDSTFYIDGEDYFKAVYLELKKARKQIFITGWILTPHMYLVQKYEDFQYRIDKLLQKLAIQGVKIYIIVYYAPPIAIDINSQFTQIYLNSLHSNIKVLKHPNYMFIPFLWSHHQKIIIVDQKVAFMGGLDIGYGRMDNSQHNLSDEQQKRWKGIQYCNYRIRDLNSIHEHENCSLDRLTQPRMPWHDVGIKLSGLSVIDICRHFVQYWNYANYQLYLTERQLLMFTGIHQDILQPATFQEVIQQNKELNIDEKLINEQINIIQKTFKKQANLNWQQEQSIIIPQRVNQKIIKKQKSHLIDSFILQNLNQHQIQNKSLSKLMKNQTNIKDNKFISFVQKKSNKMYQDQPELKKLRSSQLIPHAEQQQYYLQYLINNPKKSQVFKVDNLNQQIQDKNMDKNKIQSIILTENEPYNLQSKINQITQVNKSKQTHQVLRSSSLWSLGLQQGKQQKSIMEAYYSFIQNSKNFIYIENQFFISVENKISTKIVQRIRKAVIQKQQFKVVIVLPFLPGFNGEVDDQNSVVFRVQLDLIYKTICKGQESMLSQLSDIENIQDYLAIYCLRNHGTLNGIPVTEIVYVHSKIMIVDDCIALIGSANINDRSLMGDRDSQIAIIIQDSEEMQISNQPMNLPKLRVKKFAHELRKKLYMEHFALSAEDSQHFLNYNVWDKIMFNAERNQKIYRKLFGCYPDDGIKNFNDIRTFREQAQPQRYEELKILLKGFACPFQKQFLCNQNLQLHSGQKQYYIPFINFT